MYILSKYGQNYTRHQIKKGFYYEQQLQQPEQSEQSV